MPRCSPHCARWENRSARADGGLYCTMQPKTLNIFVLPCFPVHSRCGDAILVAMYAVSYSAEGDCYLCVPPDPGIEAAALGTGEAAALGASAFAAPGACESALS
ncbi:unnamed protein product, partial [Closterium sp. NIES-53]